ncbi:putative cell wall function protein [Scheffersomyces xylosifermentans]|uniref:putative cell wall function protein n=1 Tax=Scheffersomyces xylosifermentans TaxID=1304137 RepID=UPI00315D8BCD
MLFRTYIIAASTLLSSLVSADPNTAELVGTWSSKSNTVFTGPGFYDPVDELLIEPDLPGISYSFTEDGHYEEAMYRVQGNPQNHACPIGSVTYQHGTYELLSNGSLVLTPIAVDGRQLLSDPCGGDPNKSSYTRYVQPTWFKTYQVYVDPYHGRYTLQIYQFDGSKMQPLYLAYRPPLMLPTYALNPTDDASKTKSSLGRKVKRSLENQYRTNAVREVTGDKFELYWWFSVACLGVASTYVFMR